MVKWGIVFALGALIAHAPASAQEVSPSPPKDFNERFGIPERIEDCDKVGERVSPSDAELLREMAQTVNQAKRETCRRAYRDRQAELEAE